MIATIDSGCAKQQLIVSLQDAFQLSTPCWMKSTWSQLPPEVINTKGMITMPIQKINVTAAPPRKSHGVGGSPIPEIAEVIEALKTMKPTEAIRLILSKETVERLSTKKNGDKKIPARVIIGTLRKKFSTGGLPYTAYTVDDKEIIVTKK